MQVQEYVSFTGVALQNLWGWGYRSPCLEVEFFFRDYWERRFLVDGSPAILEEMRWPGGRKRLEVRHAEEVARATRQYQVEEEKKLADSAATRVQGAFRSKKFGGGAASPTR